MTDAGITDVDNNGVPSFKFVVAQTPRPEHGVSLISKREDCGRLADADVGEKVFSESIEAILLAEFIGSTCKCLMRTGSRSKRMV
jgi:hypothetical protein